jgi:hypothetical protein
MRYPGPVRVRSCVTDYVNSYKLVKNNEVLKRYDSRPSKLHRRIFDLLEVPATAYQVVRTTPLQFERY